ncbi:NADH dehydrogenase [ubiquinone] 1 beta subcomplex subunit [Lachnellula subtilissima]|uniref:NADH dehydrogenase [ubiquinone] 1 beta subcomplex subunit 9 n=1 Tax=Lachnellula subtilissima TaxID=602034 RepID=A0A8H8RIC8_9HELO|nr:NADH dehydrogenase [ubiquinone] 1 beta subcomplex subunit [Lachnellula subtilissima]
MSTKQVVSSLYRRSLKLALDWSVHRYLWRGQAVYIRSLFDANKNIRDPRQQKASRWHQALPIEAEVLLEKWKHPDPYRAPTAPGGSKFERNLPPPNLDPPPHIQM